jgi:hypothetical protein
MSPALEHANMSEHSKGHCDQQEFPAIPTSSGDSHEGELHRSSINRSVPSEARMVANGQHDAVQNQDYESHEATVDEDMVDREQTPSATNAPDHDREYLDWKARGRPDCSKCLKSPFGATCRLNEMERELLDRDPEGYARYRKRMKKSRNRRFKHREGEQQGPPPQQPLLPLQQPDQPSVHQSVPHTGRHTNNPWLLQRGAKIIRDCPTRELEGLPRRVAAWSSGAILAQMVAAAQQERRVAGVYFTEPQPSDNRGDTIPDRVTTNDSQAPDVAAAPDTPSTDGPSVEFRTGSERAYHRGLELGGPSAKAEGKQPKK